MGLILRKTLPSGSTLALWQITETEGELRALVDPPHGGDPGTIPADDDGTAGTIPAAHSKALGEIYAVRAEALRKEKLAVLAILDTLFHGRLTLDHLPSGRPLLIPAPTPSNHPLPSSVIPYISITHTAGFAAVLTDPARPVGIDIEAVTRDFSAVERAALSPGEVRNLPAEPSERNISLGIIWCSKESVYKTAGKEAYDYASAIEILPFTPASASLTAVFKGTAIPLRRELLSGLILVHTI